MRQVAIQVGDESLPAWIFEPDYITGPHENPADREYLGVDGQPVHVMQTCAVSRDWRRAMVVLLLAQGATEVLYEDWLHARTWTFTGKDINELIGVYDDERTAKAA